MKAWSLSESDVAAVALGAGVLGTGGGGNVRHGFLRVRDQLRQGRRVEVISPDRLGERDAVIQISGIGAPTVGYEKPDAGDECYRALRAVEERCAVKARALMAAEIGGANAMEPMIAAAMAGLPVVDCDTMGRAFPEMHMTTLSIHCVSELPAALTDDKGNLLMIEAVASDRWLEKLVRTATIAMGCTAVMASAPIEARHVKAFGIRNTVSQAWRIGSAIQAARQLKADPVTAVLESENGKLLFTGKISDLERSTGGGFTRGRFRVQGLGKANGELCDVEFQNENLIARRNGAPVATVPDLISVLESDTGRPVSTEELRYGQRISVIGIPCAPILRTAQALAVVGPAAFGYREDFVPVGEYVRPKPAEALAC